MQCDTCHREMTALFYSNVCDWCDYPPDKANLHKGYCLRPQDPDACRYVFRSYHDAERFSTSVGRSVEEIVEVFSLKPFRWHLSRGTLRDVVLADHMFQVYPDHRFPTDQDYVAFMLADPA